MSAAAVVRVEEMYIDREHRWDREYVMGTPEITESAQIVNNYYYYDGVTTFIGSPTVLIQSSFAGISESSFAKILGWKR